MAAGVVARPRQLRRRTGGRDAPPPVTRRTLVRYLVMPRPKDLFKAFLMPLTFGLAALAAGGVDGRTMLRAVIVLAALEFLVYPARYQWNDVRGFAADQRHPAAADRGRLPGPLGRARPHITASVVVAVIRLLATAALPVLLPGLALGPILAVMVAGVFGVAIAYEAVRTAATGRTGEVPPPVRPALALLWVTVGAGYVVRGLTGLALVVDLHRHPVLTASAGVTLWAAGVAFVTSRWALEATAFARFRHGRVHWTADAGHAREHLLALVRWLPEHPDPRHVSGLNDGRAAGWTALRGRTSAAAPWNLATVLAGTAAALTGCLLAGPVTTGNAVIVPAAGALAAVLTVLVPRGRGVAVLLGGVGLLGVLLLRASPQPVIAVLPWLATMLAYRRFCGGCLAGMGATGQRLRAQLTTVLTPVVRVLVGRATWDALTGRGPIRA
jgi:hypothetical protein